MDRYVKMNEKLTHNSQNHSEILSKLVTKRQRNANLF